MTTPIVEVVNDLERKRAAAFLADHIPGNLAAVFSVSLERSNGGPASFVLRTDDDAGIAAVVHIGPPFEDASWFLRADREDLAELLITDTRMVNSIAVRPELRRHGVASALLAEGERRVMGEGVQLIYGVANGGVEIDAFYRRHGYEVGPAATPMLIRLGDDRVMMPLDGQQNRWFFKVVNQDPSAKRPYAMVRTPTARQIELHERESKLD